MNLLNEEYLSTVWSRVTNILVDHGKGIYLYNTEGKRFMDFTSGIGVVNTGHCHPKVVEAIQKQSNELIFGQINIIYHKPVLSLIEELRSILPSALDRFFFSNSGAEAVEAAVKLAKQATGRSNIIVFQGGFHGRTHLTMAMTTSKTIYRSMYQPLVPGIFVSPYPYPYYYGWENRETLDFAVRELKRLLKTQTAPKETAAIIVEPVLGEGGYVVPPAGFLSAIRKICDEHGILMIVDEIQSGFGRTGKYFAFQHEEIVPDIITMAKGIASGLPLSGIAYRQELGEKWLTGSHGGTYGGNPIACAAAEATIRVIKEEKLLQNAGERGKQLLKALSGLKKEFSFIGDVRGIGLMAGVEFSGKGNEIAAAVQREALEKGLLLLTCGAESNIIRWIPPLIVTGDQMDEALNIFRKALERTINR